MVHFQRQSTNQPIAHASLCFCCFALLFCLFLGGFFFLFFFSSAQTKTQQLTLPLLLFLSFPCVSQRCGCVLLLSSVAPFLLLPGVVWGENGRRRKKEREKNKGAWFGWRAFCFVACKTPITQAPVAEQMPGLVWSTCTANTPRQPRDDGTTPAPGPLGVAQCFVSSSARRKDTMHCMRTSVKGQFSVFSAENRLRHSDVQNVHNQTQTQQCWSSGAMFRTPNHPKLGACSHTDST